MSRCVIRPIALTVVALSILAAAPRTAGAQDMLDRLLGQPIAAVEVQIEGRTEASAPLLALVDIKPGELFTVETYRRVADRFTQVPRFENVRVLADERPSGLVLIFDLEPRHPVDRMEFTGDTGIPAGELQRLVQDHFNGVPALTRLSEVQGAVERLLHNEGYWSASVDTRIVQFHEPDRATLEMAVQAGPRTTIGSIDLRNQSPWSDQRILERLDLTVGAPYRARTLSAGLARVRDDLRGMGYYTAVARHVGPDLTKPAIELIVIVEAGPLVRLEVVGDSLPGSEDDFIPIKRQGSVDQDLLDDSRSETERALRQQGYWRASVTYERQNPSPDEQRIIFTVSRGKRYRVDRVDLPEGLQISQSDLQALEALEPGAWFSQDAVMRALLVLRAIYQELGFYKATLDPKFDEVPGRRADEGGVVIRPNIVEGPKAVLTEITFDLGESPRIGAAELQGVMRARARAPFVLGHVVTDREAIQSLYERQGFLNHSVAVRHTFNEAGTEATLLVQAREGEQVLVGEIIIVGNNRASRELILSEITLREGQPYSEAARLESQRRLYNQLGFRSAQVTAQPRLPGETETRILISVEETGAVTFGFGGGVEAGTTPRRVESGGFEDRLEFSPRASIDIGRRNLGGRNRAVNLFARISLKPRNAPDDPDRDGKGFGFTEYRVNATYRERYAFGTNADFLAGVSSEQAVRTTFSYLRQGMNADILRPLTPRLSLSGRYTLEFTELFDERLDEEERSLIDRLFPQVRLSTMSTTLFWDRRDNQISPTSGALATATIDLAPRWLGSEVGFVKAFLEGSAYRPLVAPRRLILAGRVQLGLARGFERSVPVDDENGDPILDSDGNPVVDVVADLPASQRFFAGGSTTVRGFQLDRLGVAEILNPNGLSDGGNALIVLNAELRAQLTRRITVVGFLDAGNVFDRVGDLDLGRLRATAGFGTRVDSPFGPVRLDIGFKLDRMTFQAGRERRWEFHLSIAEVF